MKSQTNFRRSHARRHKERRSNPFEFNSAEWIALMKEHYVLWPKQDRRNSDRRALDRRAEERRSFSRNAYSSRHIRQPQPQPLLTASILEEDEKQMILDLFRDA